MSGRFHEGGVRRQDRTARDAPPEKVHVSHLNVRVGRPMYDVLCMHVGTIYYNTYKYQNKNESNYLLVIIKTI